MLYVNCLNLIPNMIYITPAIRILSQSTGETVQHGITRGELSYLAPLGSENISAPYLKQRFFQWPGGVLPPPQTESNTTPPRPNREITDILFYILNFASVIKFKM